MKKIILIVVAACTLSACVGMQKVAYRPENVKSWITAVNSSDALVPHTVIAESVKSFLNAPDNGKKKKVLFIGYDGVRLDSVAKASTEAVEYVAQQGGLFYSYVGGEKLTITQQKTYSGPGWATILTGVWANKHKFSSNSTSSKSKNAPSFLAAAEKIDSSLNTVSMVTWGTINLNILQNELNEIDYHYEAESDADLFKQAKIKLSEEQSDVVFIAFDDPDHAGHTAGFSPDSSEYLDQISLTDSYAMQLLKTVEARDTYNEEEWYIIISTDHGGIGLSHGRQSKAERNVWIAVNRKEFIRL